MEADSYLKDRKLLEWIARILEDRQPPSRRKVKAKQTGVLSDKPAQASVFI